jgi:hypothetical protein
LLAARQPDYQQRRDIYREEVRALAEWFQENKLPLNINKTKDLIVDYK